MCCGYSSDIPSRDAYKEYPQHLLFGRNKKNLNTFWLKKKKCLIWRYEYFVIIISQQQKISWAKEKVSWPHVESKIQGPVVQSVVSLTSSLVVKMLTVLVSTIPNSQVFLLKKCE